MNDSTQSDRPAKSPLVLLLLVGVLVIGTLVAASDFFLRPQLESELKKEITQNFSLAGFNNTKVELSGRDVILNGTVSSQAAIIRAESATKKIWGIRDVSNKLLITK